MWVFEGLGGWAFGSEGPDPREAFAVTLPVSQWSQPGVREDSGEGGLKSAYGRPEAGLTSTGLRQEKTNRFVTFS